MSTLDTLNFCFALHLLLECSLSTHVSLIDQESSFALELGHSTNIEEHERQVNQYVAYEEHYVDPTCKLPRFIEILLTSKITKVGSVSFHVNIVDVSNIHDVREGKEAVDNKDQYSFIQQFKVVIQLSVVRFDDCEDSELSEEADQSDCELPTWSIPQSQRHDHENDSHYCEVSWVKHDDTLSQIIASDWVAVYRKEGLFIFLS